MSWHRRHHHHYHRPPNYPLRQVLLGIAGVAVLVWFVAHGFTFPAGPQ